jgi:hypothetical protein
MELKDEKLKEDEVALESEIENLQKYVQPCEESIKNLESIEELDEKGKQKLQDHKDELLLLKKEIIQRQVKISEIYEELKNRAEIKKKIEELIDSVDFEEEETHKYTDRETQEEVEYKVKFVHRFFHHLGFCDHIKYKEEIETPEGKTIEVEKKKEVFWNKKLILKHLKENLDVEKAQSLVDQIANYKHHKKRNELESKLRPLIQNNVYFLEAFGEEAVIIKGERYLVHESDRIAKWDKDDLEDFEAKVLKLELAKKHLDDKEKKEKPLKDRQLEYSKIDGLLLEALVEKIEEGRPEKMVKYLELRKDIKNKHPLED